MHYSHQSLARSCNRRKAITQLLSLFAAATIACACLFSMGCDMGTYNQRLNEKPVEQVPAADVDENDAAPDDQ